MLQVTDREWKAGAIGDGRRTATDVSAGLIKNGMTADITLFDAQAVGDAATFESPIRPAPGIEAVIVNGEIAWRDRRSTGALPGRVLAGAAGGNRRP